MIKSQLIKQITKKLTHIPEKDLVECINTILEKMSEELSMGSRIEIRGFGSFSLHYRAAHHAHNPKTGERLMTQPKYKAHFKVGKELRERINQSA